MTRRLVLDAFALDILGSGRPSGRKATVRAALREARRHDWDVFVPAVVLAELYRGRNHNQAVDSCLAREAVIEVRDTDRDMAKRVGAVLAGAEAGSEHLVDAHVVATCAEAGGGFVLTGDPGDLRRLAAGEGVEVRSL